MSNIDELLDTPEQSEEEVEETEEVTTDNLDDLTKEELAEALIKLDASKKQLYARATKAEARLKESKTPTNKNVKTNDLDFDNRVDEKLLKRDGFTDDDINLLKDIQAINLQRGIKLSLEDASKESIFSVNLKARQEAERKAKAQLNSNGGSSYESPIDLATKDDGRIDMEDLKNKFNSAQ
jgi:hypothetical protein